MTCLSPWLPGYRGKNYPAQGRRHGDFLCGLWTAACDALRATADESNRTTRILRNVLPAWADERIGTEPARPSYVADDGFLAEMSVNWSGRHPELRVLFDCADDGYHDASRLGPGQIGQLFVRNTDCPSSAPVWHSVAWRPQSQIVHKTYFGLYGWPHSQRYAVVAEAMDRLGLTAAWDDTRRRVDDVSGQREIEFFAVDQVDEPDARVKIYYRNHGASVNEMNHIASVASCHDSDAALVAYQTLTGDRPDAGEAALTCLAFRSGCSRATESTTYLRLADLALNDRQAVGRTAALLRSEGTDPSRLHYLATALVPEPLERSRGFLALVSYRAAGRRSDVTTYFRFPVYACGDGAPVDHAVDDHNNELA